MNTVSLFEQYPKGVVSRVGTFRSMASALSFVDTRSRSTDPDTSREAAKAAVSGKAAAERLAIGLCVQGAVEGLTAREVAALTGIDYIAVQRRLSECGLTKTASVRDGCRVWVA